MTPNANHAPTIMAPINPIKLRNGRPIFVLSEIFTDMIDTHQNLNLILLMLLLYIVDCKINPIHLLHQTLLYIVYIVFSLNTCPPVNKFFPPTNFNFRYFNTLTFFLFKFTVHTYI